MSRGRKCFQLSTVPTLLIAGGDDTVDSFTGFDIVGGVRTIAPQMTNSGRAIIIENTGHSIDHERPAWLAGEIVRFLAEVPVREVVSVARDEGRIARLNFAPPDFIVAPATGIDLEEAIRTARWPGGATRYWVRSPDGSRNRIWARRIVRTASDGREANNLRALPETRQSVPVDYWAARSRFGPPEGFEVTHIRLRTAGPAPWETWVSHLCNDDNGYQIPTAEAEARILRGEASYHLMAGGERTALHVVEYLYTRPNETTEDNLSSLPEV